MILLLWASNSIFPVILVASSLTQTLYGKFLSIENVFNCFNWYSPLTTISLFIDMYQNMFWRLEFSTLRIVFLKKNLNLYFLELITFMNEKFLPLQFFPNLQYFHIGRTLSELKGKYILYWVLSRKLGLFALSRGGGFLHILCICIASPVVRRKLCFCMPHIIISDFFSFCYFLYLRRHELSTRLILNRFSNNCSCFSLFPVNYYFRGNCLAHDHDMVGNAEVQIWSARSSCNPQNDMSVIIIIINNHLFHVYLNIQCE